MANQTIGAVKSVEIVRYEETFKGFDALNQNSLHAFVQRYLSSSI